MIPRFRPVLGRAEFAAMLRPAGPDDVAAFEAAFARSTAQKHAVAFPYGRTGLLALTAALGLNKKTVICPAYTCVVVPHAVALGHAAITFIDAAADANMDLDRAEKAARAGAAAIIATSVFGHPVDLDRLDAIGAQFPQLAVIQDCAHAFTARWKGRPVNQAGCAAIFGLNASKIMTSIFGGMVTTDQDDLAAVLRREREKLVRPAPLAKSVARSLYLIALYAAFLPPLFGLTETLRRMGLLDRFTRYYDETKIDMPDDFAIALTSVEARVGAVQTLRLGDFIAARRRYADFYHHWLSGHPGLSWIPAASGASYSHMAARVANRDAVMRAAARKGVQLGEIIEYSIPEMSAYRDLPGSKGDFPVAHALSRQTINLPVSGRFHEATASRVAAVMQEILRDQPPAPPLP